MRPLFRRMTVIPVIADLFLAIVKTCLETIGPDPYQSAKSLYTVTYFENEICGHLDNVHSLLPTELLQYSLKIEEASN